MLGYGMLEAWIRENTGYQVTAYHFFGDDEAHPLSEMPEILARAKQHKVVCTAGYCLKPKKAWCLRWSLRRRRRAGRRHMAAESAHIAAGGTHARTVGRTALSGGKMKIAVESFSNPVIIKHSLF